MMFEIIMSLLHIGSTKEDDEDYLANYLDMTVIPIVVTQLAAAEIQSKLKHKKNIFFKVIY